MSIRISALPPIVTPSLTDIFPVSQAGVTYKETCTQLAALLVSASAFSSIVTKVFTANGTYTPTSGMKYCIVEAVGAGGGGGGCALTGAAQVAASSGGGGGEYARSVLSAATIGVSKAVAIGASGTAGTAGANNGGTGGNTTLGTTLVIAVGGTGGGGATATGTNQTIPGGAGGTGGTGTLLVDGQLGQGGIAAYLATAFNAYNGRGGDSALYGSGGNGSQSIGVDTSTSTGSAGSGYGGGGAGCRNATNCAAQVGAPGAQGIMIITEFI